MDVTSLCVSVYKGVVAHGCNVSIDSDISVGVVLICIVLMQMLALLMMLFI